MHPFGTPHGLRPSHHRSWPQTCTPCNQIGSQAPRRYANGPGGRTPGGVGSGIWALGQRGPSTTPNQVCPKRAMRCAVARFLAAKYSAGAKEPCAPLARPRPRYRELRQKNRGHRSVQPTGEQPPDPATALVGHKALGGHTICPLWKRGVRG
jgi:hypothetical protein